MFSLKQSLISHLALKFLRITICYLVTGNSATVKTSHERLQLFVRDCNLMLMMKRLQKLAHCKSTMQLQTICLLTLRLFHVKIFLQEWQNLFMIQFNTTLQLHFVIDNLHPWNCKKVLHPKFQKTSLEKIESNNISSWQNFGIPKNFEPELCNFENNNSDNIRLCSTTFLWNTFTWFFLDLHLR